MQKSQSVKKTVKFYEHGTTIFSKEKKERLSQNVQSSVIILNSLMCLLSLLLLQMPNTSVTT